MKQYKRILTIQDISCFGQCSLTVALPIISACGHETCVIPSAVLSTHTSGFKNFTFRDLASDITSIKEHWITENIKFDALYTGYLGSVEQIEYIKEIASSLLRNEKLLIVDPAMADNGKLYPAFDQEYVDQMKTLCVEADIILPNITEACLLDDRAYLEHYTKDDIMDLLTSLVNKGSKKIILTGVSYNSGTTGVVIFDGKEYQYYEHKLISKGCHGTGDVYASCFVGALLQGYSLYESSKIAADYTVSCIECTNEDKEHWYGVKFEMQLPNLIKLLNQ